MRSLRENCAQRAFCAAAEEPEFEYAIAISGLRAQSGDPFIAHVRCDGVPMLALSRVQRETEQIQGGAKLEQKPKTQGDSLPLSLKYWRSRHDSNMRPTV